MDIIKTINVKNSVSIIKYFDGKIGVIDKRNTFRIFDLKNYDLIGGFKIHLPENNPLENSVDISSHGNYLAIAIKGKNKTTIWDINNKKLLHTLGWHKGEVLSVSFDKDENYLLTGGMDGRAYLWSVNTGSMVSSLPHHPDYILSSGFSINSLWCATGSYDRLISIVNITSININYRKKFHRGAVTKILFLKHRMVSGDKTGELIIWDYTKGKIVSRLPSVADMVIDMAVDEKEEYLFVITKKKKVYLYSLKDFDILSDQFIKLNEFPSSIEYISETSSLLIGTLNGSIYIYDVFSDVKKLANFIEDKKYDDAYELIKRNPFLKRSEEYQKLENIWNKTIELAYKFMEQGSYEKAKQILKPFLAIPYKRTIIQNILNDFGEFEKFKQAVLKQKYPLAYSLANQYPSFKETAYYKKMENDFKKVFNKAKELIKIKGQEEKVRQILMPFRGVSQKTPLIQSLFNDKNLYNLLNTFFAKKQFDKFFELISRNPFLYESYEYEKAMKYAQKLEELIKEFLQKGEFKKVLTYSEILRHFPKYKEKADDFIKQAKVYMNFLSALSNNNYDLVEKLVIENPFLYDSEDYNKYKQNINKFFKKAEEFSKNADIKNILDSLKEVLNSKIYFHKILGLIKSAYLNQLLNALKEKNKEKIQRGINSYISYFGIDNEIKDIINIANKLKLNPKISTTEQTKLIDFNSLPDFIWDEV